MLNQSEPNLILTAHATKLNRPEPNWTEPQTCLAGRNHALRHMSEQTKSMKGHVTTTDIFQWHKVRPVNTLMQPN